MDILDRIQGEKMIESDMGSWAIPFKECPLAGGKGRRTSDAV